MRFRLGLVLVWVWAWLATIDVSAAADLYVDAVSGSDATGDGSLARPWKTVTFASPNAARGDDLRLAAGLYDAASGEVWGVQITQCVSVHGDPAGGTVFATGEVSQLLQVDYGECPGQTIENITLQGPGRLTSTAIKLWPNSNRLHEDLVLRQLRIEGFRIGVNFERETWIGGAVGEYTGFGFLAERNIFSDVGTALRWSLSLVRSGPGPLLVGNNKIRTITNNQFIGYDVGISLIARCTSAEGCEPGLELADLIWNNTFTGGGTAIDLYGEADQVPASVHPIIVNNVFHQGNNITIKLAGPKADVTRLSTNDFWDHPAGFLRDDAPRVLRTIAEVNAFRASTGDNISADPLFIDAASGDLHLLRASPCIDTGTDSGAPVTDFDGDVRPEDGDGDRVARTDIGADEAPAVIDLRRGDFTTFRPPTPPKVDFFPFDGSNPLTPVVKPDFVSGERDPVPSLSVPLSFYQVGPDPGVALLAVTDRATGTVQFLLRR